MSNPIERFCAALEAEAREERRAKREAEKLPPLTIVIADQEELKRIYALAASRPYKQNVLPMIRGHLRCWSREELEKARREKAS